MYEWDNPHPCNDETEEYEFDMTIANCLWHNWGSVMEQGSDIAPRYPMCCSPLPN
jgi:hypothetical protein